MFKYGDERYERYVEGKYPRGLGIQIYRKLCGITQNELAEQLGVTASAVSSWETGRVAVAPERLEEISQILGISTAKLKCPTPEDVDKASHVALYDGDVFRRPVLRVEHTYNTEDWPEDWMYTEQGRAEALEKLKARARDNGQGSLFSYSQKYSERDKITWGPNRLFSSYPNGGRLSLNRFPPTFSELLSVYDSPLLALGRVLRCIRLRMGMPDRWLVGLLAMETWYRIELTLEQYNLFEIAFQPFDSVMDNEIAALESIEQILHLDRGTLVLFTPAGRRMASELRSQSKNELPEVDSLASYMYSQGFYNP